MLAVPLDRFITVSTLAKKTFRVSDAVWEEVRDLCRAYRDYTMSAFAADAMRQWVREHEALEAVIPPSRPGSGKLIKPAGEPFPYVANPQSQRGAPAASTDDRSPATVRVDQEVLHDFMVVVHWLGLHWSLAMEEAIGQHLQRLKEQH